MLYMNEFDIFDIDGFVTRQARARAEYVYNRDNLLEQLMERLCRESEAHILHVNVPMCISIEQFFRQSAGGLEKFQEMSIAQMSGSKPSAMETLLEELSASESVANISLHSSVSKMESTVLHSQSHVTAAEAMYSSHDPHTTVISYTEKAAVRNGCRKFLSLLRFSDFIVRNAMYESVEQSFAEFMSYISNRIVKTTLEVERLLLFSDMTSKSAEVVTVGRNTVPLIRLSVLFSSTLCQNLSSAKFIDSQYGLVKNKAFAGDGSKPLDAASVAELNALALSFNARNEIVLEPEKDEVIRKLRGWLFNTLNSGMYTSRFMDQPACRAILEPIRQELVAVAEPSEFSFENLKDNSVNTSSSCICQVISRDFDDCLEYLSKYNRLLLQYEKNVTTYEAAERNKLVDASPDQIIASMLEFKSSIEDSNSIERFQNFGSFRLDFSQFKSQLCLHAESCISLFSRLVPDLYTSNGETLYLRISTLSDVLIADFKNLDEYVKVVETHNKANDQLEELSARFLYMMGLKEIIETYRMAKSDGVVRQHLTLQPIWQRFTQQMVDFDGILADNATIFKTELRNRTKALIETVTNIKKAMQEDYMCAPESDPDNVLHQLGHLKIELDDAEQNAKRIAKYQLDLNFPVFNDDLIVAVVKLLNSNYVLWSVVKSVRELQVNFMAINFLDAASEDALRQLDLAITTLNTVTIPSDRILSWLKQTITELLVIAPIIKKLQKTARKDIYTSRIHSLFNRNIFDEEDLTVGELVDVVGIRNYIHQLDDIYEESQYLSNLEMNVSDVLKACTAKKFSFRPVTHSKTIVHVDNFSEIKEFFEDALLTVKSCMSSKFSKASIKSFEEAFLKISHWITVTKKFTQIQDGYYRLRLIFNFAKTARYFIGTAKHFKLIEDCWRNFSKLAKNDVHVTVTFSTHGIDDSVEQALTAIKTADDAISQYIEDQYDKWPKLRILLPVDLITILSTHDPEAIFSKCRVLFPQLTGITFQPYEPLNAISVQSMEESIEFKKACSARVSLVEWLSGIESAMSDRLESDIMKFVNDLQLLYEDLRSPKASEQSKICAIQVKFWRSLLSHMTPTQRSNIGTFLVELSDQIAIFSNSMLNHYLPYHIKSMSNLLTLLIYHREIVSRLIAEDSFSAEIPFFIESAIKKVWNIGSSPLYVCQGQMKFEYGMHYFGFCDRLVVTPLTDKCFLSITHALRNNSIPYLCGPHGVGKKSIVQYVIYELGYDCFNFDCSIPADRRSLRSYLAAALGSPNGIWLAVINAENLPVDMYNFLLTTLSSILRKIQSKSDFIIIDGEKCRVSTNLSFPPKFSVSFNTINPLIKNDMELPLSVRKQFRQLCISRPPDIRHYIVKTLLTANNFAAVQKVTDRICAIFDYLVDHNLVRESLLFRTLAESIRYCGEKNIVATTITSLHSAVLAKTMISKLPVHISRGITDSDLRFICNLFLEITYSKETDLNEFKPISKPEAVMEALVDFIIREPHKGYESLSHSASIVLIVGDANIGKSSLIEESIRRSIQQNQTAIDRETAFMMKNFDKNKKPIVISKIIKYDWVVNPFLQSIPKAKVDSGRSPAEKMMALIYGAQQSIGGYLNSQNNEDATTVYHFECHSSALLCDVLYWLTNAINRKVISVKVIWEIAEITHIDPFVAAHLPIMFLHETRHSREDKKQYHMKNLISRYKQSFIALIE